MENSEDKKVKVDVSGKDLLRNSVLNKGSAFPEEERKLFNLEGLLPPHVSCIDEQLKRRQENFHKCSDNLAKYNFLTDLQNRNETLFFRFCMENVNETLPYIYTPVVGEASLNFSLGYHYSRGIYIPFEKMDEIELLLRNAAKSEIEVIVATDGGRILGLGDVGVGGMTIPIGKTSLYTLFGGVHPSKVLPVFLDVGTDNDVLLKDPLYLGRKKHRKSGDDYYEFMDKFVTAVKKVFPKALLQWEDLLGIHAQKVLDRYRNEVLSFNDDIQGTSSIVLAGLLTALKMKGSSLRDENIVVFGGGAAGLGIAKSICAYLVYNGMNETQAKEKICVIDRYGLTYKGQDKLRPEHEFFAKEKPANTGDEINLEETVKLFKTTILIGASAQKDAFSQKTLENLANNTSSPIIFPLSNPDSKAEATPEKIINATKGSAIVATGTAFPDVHYGGKTFHIGQCNNVYIFPAMGLFTTAFDIKTIPDEFFYIAGETLAEISPPLLFPKFEHLRTASKKIAIAVARYASQEGLIPKLTDSQIQTAIDQVFWEPKYNKYIK
ncbi:MAG: NAD-dependent malic enzyme [Chlamydiia bacterium]|nr:NAD-dependent malic enzyme [Chlamydiia bacterium]